MYHLETGHVMVNFGFLSRKFLTRNLISHIAIAIFLLEISSSDEYTNRNVESTCIGTSPVYMVCQNVIRVFYNNFSKIKRDLDWPVWSRE